MKSKLIILGCGSSVGVPRIDGFWGNCKKNVRKNIRTRCSAIIVKGNNLEYKYNKTGLLLGDG